MRNVLLSLVIVVILLAGVLILLNRSQTGSEIEPDAVQGAQIASPNVDDAGTGAMSRRSVPESTTLQDEPAPVATPGIEPPPVDEFESELARRDLTKQPWGTSVLDFEKAEVYAKDPKFNPLGIELDADGMKRLRALIDKLNRRLEVNRSDCNTVVGSHIQDKIDRGQAIVSSDGSEPDLRSLGSDGTFVGRAQGGKSYYMRMREGDFPDLDRLMRQNGAIVQLGEEWIARQFH